MTMPYSSASAGVGGIVFGEGVVPHGGPQVVALHAQDDFEDFGVEGAVEVRGRAAGDGVFAEFGADPEIEVGLFVIEEDAAVFDAGLTLLILAGENVERGLVIGRDVGPPVPRGDADLFGEVVNAEDRAALVAAGDDQGAVDAGQGVGDGLQKEGFPFAANAADVDLARAG